MINDLSFETFLFSIGVGLCATIVMTIIEIPAWRKFGLRGVLEWHENQVLSTKFFRLSGSDLHTKGILLLHFANGGLGGFGYLLILIVFPFAASNLILSSAAYGVFLWIVTLIPIHKPITGIIPWKHPDGYIPMITSLIGHLSYGIIMGVIFLTF